MGGEKRLGVPAETEVGVHGHRLRSGKRRSEQLQHAIEHDRNVTTRLTGLVRQRFQPPLRRCTRGFAAVPPVTTQRIPTHAGSFGGTDPPGQVPIRVACRGV
ncbi:hypothetical protein Mame01_10690 [Microbispora amethystogenes]|nr:hypothetical protein Mame01_10690 [Microbispora amethystogenes]